jgi:hypothetical protein
MLQGMNRRLVMSAKMNVANFPLRLATWQLNIVVQLTIQRA